MMGRAFALAALCGLAACRGEAADPPSNFEVQARRLAEGPWTVFLTIDNRSPNYLCVASADLRLGSGFIDVLPASGSDIFENRPPPDLVAGVDVSEGLQVIPPNAKRDLLIDLSPVEGRRPRATGLSGKVRALACRNLFSAARPLAREQNFGVSLVHAP